jgi:hypothetical protein
MRTITQDAMFFFSEFWTGISIDVEIVVILKKETKLRHADVTLAGSPSKANNYQ